MIYMKWVRFAVDVALDGKTFVMINMDETSINTIQDDRTGLTLRKSPHQSRTSRQPDPLDRSNVKTSLLAAVCDSAALQPHIPQVILVKYTQQAVPPRRLQESYASTGEPLEYWHGTGGWATTRIIKNWATRVRSLVHSFNPDAWIVVIWDCSSTHLNMEVVLHMRRLGFLVIMLPAKLTGLLQVCDVHVFHELKSRIRSHQSFLRCSSATGTLNVGDWVSCFAAGVRDVVVNRSWEDAFDKMGLGANLNDMAGNLRRLIDPDSVTPRLPTLVEFGRLVNKRPDTILFRRMHENIMRPFLQVRAEPLGALPPRGALVPLPDLPAARKRPTPEVEARSWDDVLEWHLHRTAPQLHTQPHGRAPAVNRRIAPPVDD